MPAHAVAMGELYRWKESRDVPDTLNAMLEYPEGFVVNLSSTFNNQTSAEGSFQFLGTEGALTLGGGLTFYPETAVEDNRWPAPPRRRTFCGGGSRWCSAGSEYAIFVIWRRAKSR